MSEIYSTKRKVKWLARHAREPYSVRPVDESVSEVIKRLGEGLMAPPGRSSSVSTLPRAQRREAFVTGFIYGPPDNSFVFTGYRARQWIPPVLRLGQETKPRLVGSLRGVDQSTRITYRVDFAFRAKLFFATVAGAAALLLVALATTVTLGWSVPGVSFFLFLLAGVCVVYAHDVWSSVPDGVEDEAFLNDWLSRRLEQEHPGRTDTY